MTACYRDVLMPTIHEIATLTSKGQITLPKPIRQALGVETGGKVAFDLRDGQVVVTRVGVNEDDPAIGSFLDLLETDIRTGRHVGAIPDELARAMLTNAGRSFEHHEEIEGDVEL